MIVAMPADADRVGGFFVSGNNHVEMARLENPIVGAGRCTQGSN